MMDQAAHALSRFGLGARPGEREEIADDPRGWVSEQLTLDADNAIATAGRPSAQDVAVLQLETWRLEREAQEDNSLLEQVEANYEQLWNYYRDDVTLRIEQGIETDTPIQERLVHFWTNHFTTSAVKDGIRPYVGTFERDAIRPNYMGNFYDLLIAAEQHPAMLMYLDNTWSAGPNSDAGLYWGLGLNENLAREILELHTTSTAVGYSQADVEAFAKVITGWSFHFDEEELDLAGTFRFWEELHEPGELTVLGKTYPAEGLAQGEAVMLDLARHPSTANFVATKLVRHFVSDYPDPADVADVAAVFMDTEGDLPSVYQAVFDLTSAWDQSFTKFRQPIEFIIGIGRATGIPDGFDGWLPEVLGQMGQDVYGPPSPAGWPDTNGFWLSGQSAMRRADIAYTVGRSMRTGDTLELMQDLYGDLLSYETADLLENMRSPVVAMGLALASPEMLYR